VRAVHFGAGNIGRGFIGQLLHESGYSITFVDVRDDVVDALKTEGRYEVILADEGEEHIPIDRVTALHSSRDAEEVTRRLAEADLITTAVGPSVLPVIAPAIARGLLERARRKAAPVNVIACENMVGASQALKGFVMEHVPEEMVQAVEELAGFPNAAVDRIVPEYQA
jgi:mannitol-1-phosphate 5-dehydrogenase